jgi:hypothetical protein
LGRGLNQPLDFWVLEVKKQVLSSDLWENCMILKKITIGKRPFIGVCYISRKITADVFGKMMCF